MQQLFAFHADPNNLPAVTPPGTTVTIEQMPQTLTEGSRARLFIRRGFLGFRWLLRFECVDPPYCIIDAAEQSPFRIFRHEHRFIALGERRTLLRDEVRFALPWGRIGKMAEGLAARDITRMFAYRQRRTKALLEGAEE